MDYKVKEVYNNVNEAKEYIQSLFPTRGSRGHFHESHISNRGKEAYEFNIKCLIKTAPWVIDDYESYNEQMEYELTDAVSVFKTKFKWIKECLTAGRSGGWLVITTYDRAFEDWGNQAILKGKDLIQRANELTFISKYIEDTIRKLENMSNEEAEEYWDWCKPEDWDDEVKRRISSYELAKKQRKKREAEVINYIPSDDFYYLETTHRKYLLNDRGDIIMTFDKMMRNDNWRPYGQMPDKENPLIGWNRVVGFTESGIAPRRVSFQDAKETTDLRGFSILVYNAPSGSQTVHREIVESLYRVGKDYVGKYIA